MAICHTNIDSPLLGTGSEQRAACATTHHWHIPCLAPGPWRWPGLTWRHASALAAPSPGPGEKRWLPPRPQSWPSSPRSPALARATAPAAFVSPPARAASHMYAPGKWIMWRRGSVNAHELRVPVLTLANNARCWHHLCTFITSRVVTVFFNAATSFSRAAAFFSAASLATFHPSASMRYASCAWQ